MQLLKQSTAVTVKIGPFLDDSDGKTAETGLTIAQADVRLSKNGGDIAQKNDATSCTHDELGIYGCPLNTTDTGTLGRLQLWVHESGALPVWHEYMVVTANVYDSLFSTDKLQVDLTQMGGAAQSATDLKDFADEGYDPSTNKVQGVVLCDTTTTNTDMVDISSLALEATLTDIKGSGFNTTTDSLVKIHDDHVTHITATPPTKEEVADQVWDEAISGHTGAGSFGAKNQKVVPSETIGDYKATGFSTHAAADVWAVGTRALTDKAGFSLSASGIDSIWDEVAEGTLTVRQALRLTMAMLASKSSGGGTNTLKYRDYGDTKDRLTFTVDPNGNRSSVTRDAT